MGQAFAAHAGTALPGGGSQAVPRLSETSHKHVKWGQREQPPHTHTHIPCTGSQQAGGAKASPPPLPAPGIVAARGTSLCASSLPLCVPGCGAPALWSHLLLKLLWAREGSYSDHGPTVPRSCLPSLGRCPFTPELPQQAPRSALSSTPGGHSRDTAYRNQRDPGDPQSKHSPALGPSNNPHWGDWGWLLGSGLGRRRATLLLLLPRGTREPRPGREGEGGAAGL